MRWLTESKKENQDFNNKKISYSQCAEDLLVKYIFNLRGINNPSYIDIGANNPFFLNNTAIFYENGSRGINIEPNPSLIDLFHKYRPGDTNLNLGIGNGPSELDLYIMDDPTLSSFSLEECKKYIETGKYNLIETKKINLITINELIEKYCNGIFPDFLSIDAEGMDFEIIKSIDYENTAPKVICFEAADYSPNGTGAKRNDIIDFLKNKEYYEYANTNLNAIMVKNDFWFI